MRSVRSSIIWMLSGAIIGLTPFVAQNISGYRYQKPIPRIEPAYTAEFYSEDDFVNYINIFFQGEKEYRLEDATRVDILTDTLAIEVDFAHKWYEAVGQAAHYSRMTGKDPAVVLIARREKDEKYLDAAKKSIRNISVDGRPITILILRHYYE